MEERRWGTYFQERCQNGEGLFAHDSVKCYKQKFSTAAKQASGNQSGFASFPKHVSLQKGSPLSEDLNETHRRLETGH